MADTPTPRTPPDNEPTYGPNDLLTRAQAATIIGRTVRYIDNLRTNGKIPAIEDPHATDGLTRYRYRHHDLLMYLQQLDGADRLVGAAGEASKYDSILLTREEAAELVGLSPHRLRQLDSDTLPYIKNAMTRKVRYRYSDVLAYLDNRETGVLHKGGRRRPIVMDSGT